MHEERTLTRTTMRRDGHHYVGREVWIGEARTLPIGAPVAACRAHAELLRTAAVRMAISRGRNPEDLPLSRTPAEEGPAVTVRAVLEESDLAVSVLASAYVGPDGWVLTAPLAKAAPRLDDLLKLADAVSRSLDGSRRVGPG